VSIKYSHFQYPNVDSTHTITYDADLSRAVNNPKRFTGTVYVLVNEFTFSSATVLAATVQCYGIGKLMGRETGGTQVFFDEPVVLQLPRTGQRFLASHQFRWCPCGESKRVGVVPDVPVPWHYEDHRLNTDAELEEVKRLERERRGAM
jgi:C-terminal processing protease CtpA/Prc